MASARPTKLLVVIDTLGIGGGAERLLVDIQQACKDPRVQFYTVALFDWHDDIGGVLEKSGIQVFRLRNKNHWRVLSTLYGLIRVIWRIRPDWIWSHLMYSQLYSMLASLVCPASRQMLTLHSMPRRETGFVHGIVDMLHAMLARSLSPEIVAVSRAVAQAHEQLVGMKNVRVIYNGITDISDMRLEGEQRTQIRKKYGAGPEDFLIVVPARTVKQKGHIVLWEALLRLKKDRQWTPKVVTTIGGPLDGPLSGLAVDMGIRAQICFTPALEQMDVYRLMLAGDAVVLPSLWEPFGLVATEGMLLGRPTIVSRVDGLAEIVGDSGGALLAEPGNPESLAIALWNVYTNADLRARLKENGVRRVKDSFLVNHCLGRYIDVFLGKADDADHKRDILG